MKGNGRAGAQAVISLVESWLQSFSRIKHVPLGRRGLKDRMERL